MNSLRWLANHQSADGGWGDAAGGPSNLPATMAVRAALQLTGVPAKYAGLAERAEAYIDAHGGAAGLRERCAEEPMLAAAVLTNYALADLGPWRQAPALAFEIFCLPRRWRERYLGAGPSFAGVVFGALGAARFHHAKPRNPLVRLVRRAGVRPCLAALADMQPPSGGFLASTVATSFVVMSLASVGLGDKQVVRRGVEFLLATARPDGSWPIEADRAVWNTSQAVALLDMAEAACGDEPAARQKATERAVDWLVAREQNEKVPGVRLACGGWSASGWDGGPASASVTAAALTALAASHRKRSRKRQEEVYQVVLSGLEWLLALEHEEGGWSEYRGERWAIAGRGAEVTAGVLRGLEACQRELRLAAVDAPMARRVRAAISRGVAHLVSLQGPEGSWSATWFGNQLQAEPRNRVYATAQALVTFAELGMKAEEMAERGARWLAGIQDASGGWGPVGPLAAPAAVKKGTDAAKPACSFEETAAAVGALLPYRRVDPKIEQAMESGLAWLCEAVLGERRAGARGDRIELRTILVCRATGRHTARGTGSGSGERGIEPIAVVARGDCRSARLSRAARASRGGMGGQWLRWLGDLGGIDWPRLTGAAAVHSLAAITAPFFPVLAALGEFEPTAAADLPREYRTLLAHDEHMTVAVEAYNGCSVEVRVLGTAWNGDDYTRSSLLVRPSDGSALQIGVMRIDMRRLSADVRAEIESQSAPLGRILIRHDVLRKVELDRLWRIKPGPALRDYLGLEPKVATMYGRSARIVVEGRAAVELLEIPKA